MLLFFALLIFRATAYKVAFKTFFKPSCPKSVRHIHTLKYTLYLNLQLKGIAKLFLVVYYG